MKNLKIALPVMLPVKMFPDRPDVVGLSKWKTSSFQLKLYEICADAIITPNNAEKKIYILPMQIILPPGSKCTA